MDKKEIKVKSVGINVENVENFFKLLESDAELKAELDKEVEMYPGSYEIREALCSEVLLPFAKRAGFEFTLTDLRRYETRVKMSHSQDVELDPNEPDDMTTYWLVDRGWSVDDSKFNMDEIKKSE